MIATALTFISNFLNHELKMIHGIDEDRVIVSSLINPDGSVPENIQNKIILSVVNLEHETTIKSSNQYIAGSNNSYQQIAPPVFLNLYILVSANYDADNYSEALKMLSSVIGVFQANTYFTKQKNPSMEAPIEKLTFEIFNLPVNELSHIWSGIGAKYVPSIVYKARMITIQEAFIQNETPGIGGLDGGPNPKNN